MKTQNFTPYEKLSKKKKKELNAAKRSEWGAVNPVTRRTESKKLYNRKKSRRAWINSESAAFDLYDSGISSAAVSSIVCSEI